MRRKVTCNGCGWKGHDCDVDFVADDRVEGNGWHICPQCRGADCCHVVCDVEGCWGKVGMLMLFALTDDPCLCHEHKHAGTL